MKIGIHKSKEFSKRWIGYCEEKGIPFKIVDCHRSDIVQQLDDCDVLMWHFRHDDYRDLLFAKQLIFSLQAAGKKVFPDSNTCWHFDDKVGQKYLFEAIGAPVPASYVFYDKVSAFKWIDKTSFPKVFKLRGGAASTNVKLVKSKKQARKLVRKAFDKGFPQFDRFGNLKERMRKFLEGKDSFSGFLKGVGRLFIATEFARMRNNEKGYIYFQDFISGKDHDFRIVVIGDKSFALKRMVRNNDFRASGSGNYLYEKELFDSELIRLAFQLSEKIKSQCIAYDFIVDNGKPLAVEISYGFPPRFFKPCNGYWDKELNWIEGKFDPQDWLVELIVNHR